MATLNLFPPRVRWTDETGFLTPEAYRALQLLLVRVGGATGASTTDLAISDDDDSGLEEFKAELFKTLDGLNSAPVAVLETIEHLQSELAGLREQVAVLSREIEDINQGSDYGRNS